MDILNLPNSIKSQDFNSSDYFNEMRIVSSKVKPEIIKIVNSIEKEYPLFYSDFIYYYKKRIISNKLLLRPFIFKAFLDIYNINWEEHIEIAAIIEIVNISTYQSNLAFDSKDGFNNQKTKSNQYIASIFSKIKIIEKAFNIKKYTHLQQQSFIEILLLAYEKIYYGQYIDINELSFRNLSLINSDKLFNEIYQKRCALIGSSLIEMIVSIVSVITNKKEDDSFPILQSFAYNFGLAGQVVNDLGDMVGDGKSYTNKYSDIFNEKLTFPIRRVIISNNSLEAYLLIDFITEIDNINMIKLETSVYIYSNIEKIEQDLNQLKTNGLNIYSINNISNLLSKSKYILRHER